MNAKQRLQNELKFLLERHPNFPYADGEKNNDEIFTPKIKSIRFLTASENIEIIKGDLDMSINYNSENCLIIGKSNRVYRIFYENIIGFELFDKK